MYLTLHHTKRDPSALQIHICRTVVKKCTSKSSLRYLCYNPIKSTETCSFLFIILNSKCISYSALFWNRRRDNCSSVHMMMIPIEAIFVLQFKLAICVLISHRCLVIPKGGKFKKSRILLYSRDQMG